MLAILIDKNQKYIPKIFILISNLQAKRTFLNFIAIKNNLNYIAKFRLYTIKALDIIIISLLIISIFMTSQLC